MGDKTGIEWTDSTWNPLAGCSIKSPGCIGCYAMKFAHRLLDRPGSHYEGTTKVVNGNPVWTGKINLAPDHILRQPLSWKRPRLIFVNSMSDLFHEDVPDEWIDRIFAVMALCQQHTFQILTKRSERMMKYLRSMEPWSPRMLAIRQATAEFLNFADDKTSPIKFPLPNVWLGVSVEDQERADERILDLLKTPAAIRFLSCEPLIGPIDLNRIDIEGYWEFYPLKGTTGCQDDDGNPTPDLPALDWVIVGGESGPDARPMHPDWARTIRDQCQAEAVPFFFKQWGEWHPVPAPQPFRKKPFDLKTGCARIGKKAAGRILDGRTHEDFPAYLPTAA